MTRRRSFLKTMVGSIAALSSLPASALLPATKVRIIVVGGGVAGTRVSTYFKISLPNADVMLLDPALNNLSDSRYREVCAHSPSPSLQSP